MTRRGWTLLILWLLALGGGAAWVRASLVLSADLRSFLPTPQDDAQRLLVRSVGENPASRLLLIAIRGADRPTLAALSERLAQALRADPGFALVANGNDAPLDIPDRLLPYRYLIGDGFDAQPLDGATLRAALEDRVADLGSPAGALIEEWLPRDPTLELQRLAMHWRPATEPPRFHNVWFSADGTAALLVAETRAPAFDPNAQGQALQSLRAAFDTARGATPATLQISGSGYFSAFLKERTQREAALLGSLATLGMIVLLLIAYRSVSLALLGALPLASAALAGLAAVAALFDGVHGITLAFGFTLLGVAQDYPLHLFSHLRPAETPLATARGVWRPLATGVASTCIAYLAFLVSGVVGLMQLACLTIVGLLAAGLTTRYLLPHIVAPAQRDRGTSPLLARLDAYFTRMPRPLAALAFVPLICIAILVLRPGPFWQRDLSRLAPVPDRMLAFDLSLRRELAPPDMRFLLVVTGDSRDQVLTRLESLDADLTRARELGELGSFDHAARYVPSRARQLQRRDALPDTPALRAILGAAVRDLPFDASLFEPFVEDVARAKALQPLTPEDLAGTPFALRLGSQLFERGHWYGLVSLVRVDAPQTLTQIAQEHGPDVQLLDLKAASEALVTGQRAYLLKCLAVAAVLLVMVIGIALRKPSRVVRVLAPMVLTTLLVLATLRACGVSLNLFHLISLVLAAGLGLDYALFFEHTAPAAEEQRRTLHAVLVCALSTLMVFALLAFSTVPVLAAIGSTVTLGVIGNFVLAMLITRVQA